MQPSVHVFPDAIPAPETAEDAVMSTMMALGRRMKQRYPGDEIDFSAFPILKLLSVRGPMRLSALAHLLELDASTVSRHARQLEDRGLLQRTDDPDDGRASRVAVSETGNSCLAKGFEVRRGLITKALEGWTPDERDTLRDLLHRLVQDLTTPENSQENP
jgi:DNA-binding MarR family transcriptional regulator